MEVVEYKGSHSHMWLLPKSPPASACHPRAGAFLLGWQLRSYARPYSCSGWRAVFSASSLATNSPIRSMVSWSLIDAAILR
jgi:hypothetical protein